MDVRGVLSHREAMRITANTELRLLLLYENAYSKSIVPQKLYNYLIMNGPILAVAPEVGITAGIIATTRLGTVVSPRRGVEAVYDQLKRFFLAWQQGASTIQPNIAEIDRYDYRTHTRRLAGNPAQNRRAIGSAVGGLLMNVRWWEIDEEADRRAVARLGIPPCRICPLAFDVGYIWGRALDTGVDQIPRSARIRTFGYFHRHQARRGRLFPAAFVRRLGGGAYRDTW